jgi:adenosylcobinamide kinase/adenosylcobinamide-phosphate guanylyltransferase
MFTLVVGAAASGKSAFAERLIVEAGDAPRTYIATMQPFDQECRARIEKHRAMRAEKRFTTVERYTGLSALKLPQRGSVLLECLSNLAANELYSPQGAGSEQGALDAIDSGVDNLLAQCRDLVVVSNEIFTDGVDYGPGIQPYLRLLAGANRLLARKADRVCEVVCGLPQFYKGGSGER